MLQEYRFREEKVSKINGRFILGLGSGKKKILASEIIFGTREAFSTIN